MTNDADYLTRPESCIGRRQTRQEYFASFLVTAISPAPMEQSVWVLEGMSRPSIRVECVKYFVSKQYCLLSVSYTHLTLPTKRIV